MNLIGEHTDYNDGFVLPLAIPHRTVAAVAPNDGGVLRVASTFADEPVSIALADLGDLFPQSRERISEWARYPLGVAWALQEAAPVRLPPMRPGSTSPSRRTCPSAPACRRRRPSKAPSPSR